MITITLLISTLLGFCNFLANIVIAIITLALKALIQKDN